MPISRKNFLRRFIEFRFLFLINILLIAFLGFSFGREYLRNRDIRLQIDALKQQADQLAARNLQISELHANFQSQAAFEREARLKLDMKKPGEHVVVVQPSQSPSASPPTDMHAMDGANMPDERPSDAVANPTKWWYYFFDTNQFRTL